MDAFYKVSRHRASAACTSTSFMRESMRGCVDYLGQEDPLDIISTEIARELRLLAFDEFHARYRRRR